METNAEISGRVWGRKASACRDAHWIGSQDVMLNLTLPSKGKRSFQCEP